LEDVGRDDKACERASWGMRTDSVAVSGKLRYTGEAQGHGRERVD
jgi:hypothetical protein